MYSGYLIGGPFHGDKIEVDRPFYTLAPRPRFALSKVTDTSQSDRVEQYTYAHSEEYTEWGNVVRVFIWTVSGALPRAEREKFIMTALDGRGNVYKVTKKNQKIIWPECPNDWYKRDE